MRTWVLWQNAGGAVVKVDDFVFVKMATGVGAGLFQNGNVMLGDIGYAGELGHVPISKEGLCRCGMTGCLEAHIGLPHLNERVQTHIEGTEHTLLSWFKEEASNAAQMVLAGNGSVLECCAIDTGQSAQPP